MKLTSLFVAIISSLSIASGGNLPNLNNHIRVFTGRNLTGDSKPYKLSSCVSLTRDSFDMKIQSINTLGSCVKVYGDYNCVGNNGSAVKFGDIRDHDPRLQGFSIKAVGTCHYPNCTNTKGIQKGMTKVQFASRGQNLTSQFTVPFGGCLNLRSFRNASRYNAPLEFIRLTDLLCVQLYTSPGCKGESMPFNSSVINSLLYPGRRLAWMKILPLKWQGSQSISLCGFNCIGFTNSSKNSIKTTTVNNVKTSTNKEKTDPLTETIAIVLGVLFLAFMGLCSMLIKCYKCTTGQESEDAQTLQFSNDLHDDAL